MMVRHYASECTFEVEAGWVDRTVYVYHQGDLRFVVEHFGPASTARERVEDVLKHFDRSVPHYAIVERREIDRPFRGELIVHRLPGDIGELEAVLVWTIEDRCWICRATGPLDAEDACRAVIERFLETYEPVEEP
jgi:hypothetical protein